MDELLKRDAKGKRPDTNICCNDPVSKKYLEKANSRISNRSTAA